MAAAPLGRGRLANGARRVCTVSACVPCLRACTVDVSLFLRSVIYVIIFWVQRYR